MQIPGNISWHSPLPRQGSNKGWEVRAWPRGKRVSAAGGGFNGTTSVDVCWGCDPPAATGAICTSKAALQSNLSLSVCVLDQDRCRIPACSCIYIYICMYNTHFLAGFSLTYCWEANLRHINTQSGPFPPLGTHCSSPSLFQILACLIYHQAGSPAAQVPGPKHRDVVTPCNGKSMDRRKDPLLTNNRLNWESAIAISPNQGEGE